MEKSKLKETKNNENPVAYLIDANTGEITDTFNYGDSYKKYLKENKERKIKFLDEDKNCIVFNKGVSFVKLYDDILEELDKCLTTTEFNFVIRLAKHVSYKDCILRTNGNPNGKAFDAKDLSMLFNMDGSKVRRLISSLIKKGILGRHITGCKDDPNQKFKAITCNPFIFTRGSKINNTAISLFIDSRWNTTLEKKN